MTPPLTRSAGSSSDPDPAATPRPPLQVAVVGAGAIGGAVIEALEQGRVPGARLGTVLRSNSTESEIEAAIDAADVVVEAGSVDAAAEYIRRVTATGTDIVVCSCGVFARHADPRDLLAGGPGTGRVLVPAGAIGGLDVLAAAARAGTSDASVRHYTIKRPAALDVDEQLTEPREVFRGSARRAALEFPRTSNASVALALATLGLDRTEVIVVADPDVGRTRHVVEWESPVAATSCSSRTPSTPTPAAAHPRSPHGRWRTSWVPSRRAPDRGSWCSRVVDRWKAMRRAPNVWGPVDREVLS
ncbi:DUF108 domain-containing protein [Dietzia cinnamea]|uniref:aspartate dehydrogenase domain-containing protein n=1 Tax=Dietzia cinnamea TaxID=321318 RepID=UPI0021A41904|nr:aspartate dehydrogenase domain-containing protein [Dietzia cinnamea]MCT1884662.1 DUF108 domain-containing protein [Dietzia cinnamea]